MTIQKTGPTQNGTATSTAMVPQDSSEGGAISVFASEGNFEAAQRMARALMASSLAPAEYRGNISNVLIAMELASRIRASVLMVMQNLDIIHNRPSWRSTFLIATVNSSERFSPLRFRFEREEGSDSWGCRAVATDKDTGEECVGTLVTIAMAKAEGWLQKKGSKWQTMPEQMLRYRAAAFWTRIYCPELSMGMYTADEIEDMGPATPSPSAAAAELEAALRGVAEGRAIEGEVIEDGDESEATDAELDQVANLQQLREKARAADILTIEAEEGIEEALRQHDGSTMRSWIQSLSHSLLAHAAGEQGSLSDTEG